MIQGVIQLLINASSVKQAVGLNKSTDRYKVYPVYADPDEVPPFSVAAITGNSPNQCKDGASRLDKVTVRVTTYATTYEELDKVDNAIRFCLDGYKGTSGGVNFTASLVNQQDAGVDGKPYFARISDYTALVVRNP